jgi:hypothetical protein
MNRYLKIIQSYLIYSLPAVLIIMAWGSLQDQDEVHSTFLRGVWSLLGWNIMIWFTALIVYLVSLVLVPSLRERTLTRLANIRERDEREEFITGRAARTSYISTMSLLIFCLFLSVFTVNIRRTVVDGTITKHGVVSLGLNFSLLDKSVQKIEEPGSVFESSDIPVSKPALLLLLLVWQILSFSIPARRQARESLS